MKTKIQLSKNILSKTLTAALLAASLAFAVNVARAQNLPPGVQDVVKLEKAGLSDDVILTQIKVSGTTCNLSVDQIIYLKQQGVSDPVIKALMAGSAPAPAPAVTAPAAPAPAVAPPAPAPAVVMPSTPAPPVAPPAPAPAVAPDSVAPAPNLTSFQTQLAPYGTWIQVPGYGLCWQPAVVVADPLWRPYFDMGHWDYTDGGWCWDSDYPWGGVVFHYGRWCRFNAGWVWVPGYDWAPAWVCWRDADGYCGWGPLPPAAVFKVGVGLYYNGAFALDVDFGLGIDDFTFVSYDHFWDHNLRPYWLPHDRVIAFWGHSRVLNGYRMDGGHFVMDGLGRDHIAEVTHHDVRVEPQGFGGHNQGPGNNGGHGYNDNHQHNF